MISTQAAPRAVAVVAPNAGVLDQWVAHIAKAGGDVFVYAGAAREKLAATEEARRREEKQSQERARKRVAAVERECELRLERADLARR